MLKTGMNLSGVQYWATEFPFLDRIKNSGPWQGNVDEATASVLHSTGFGRTYPASRPGTAQTLDLCVALDPVGASGCDVYELKWKGTVHPYVHYAEELTRERNRLVFRFTRTDNSGTYISMDNPDWSDPVTDMTLVRQDHVALHASGKLFNPAFVAKVRAFDGLRYMDWQATNTNQVVRWSDRTQLSTRTWYGWIDGCVPVEALVALANESKTDAWLCVPTFADDDYVLQLATYVRDHLDPALKLRLEYSNEVWNPSFQQCTLAQKEADKLWGEGVWPGWAWWYGYRSAQIATIARGVFKKQPTRLRTVLSTQTDWFEFSGYVIEGAEKFAPVRGLFDDWSITTYFDGMIRGETEADRALILSWAKADDVAPALASLLSADKMSRDAGSLAYTKRVGAYHGAVAARYGMQLVSYEGGLGFADVNFSAYGPDSALVANYLAKVQASPGMYDVYLRLLSDFEANGGTLLHAFLDMDSGFWGTNKTLYSPDTPAWKALVKFARRSKVTKAQALASLTAVDKATSAVRAAVNSAKSAAEALERLTIVVEAARSSAGAYVK